VAFLHSDDTSENRAASVEDSMMPRLDAKEVAAVFSAPFHNFLKPEDEIREGDKVPGKTSDWYNGAWIDWHEGKWRMHNFFVPINNQKVSKPKVRESGQAAFAEDLDEDEEDGMQRYKVWGMTARMLVDAARLAYGEEPEFEVSKFESCGYWTDEMKHNDHHGDEKMIENLYKMGRLGEKVPGGSDLTESDLKTARAGTVPKDASKM
jgi:coenzyme A diphosphatase NUDT7